MAMSMSSKPKTFGLNNSRDLLRKLHWEIGQWDDRKHDDDDPAIFNAFNGAVTAWHLSDWVWSDMTEEQREALSKEWSFPNNKGDFQVAVRKRDRSLSICRDIATASKHVEISRSPDKEVDTRIISRSTPVVNQHGRPLTGPSGQFLVTGVTSLLVYDGDEKTHFIEVLRDAYRFWTKFMEENGIAA